MIVSASRRTDIPAFYAPWFYNRLKEGYVLVPNPFNPRTVSRVGLTPDTVDCIVFWTKNPAPMLDGLERLRDYRYYFQFTLNFHYPQTDRIKIQIQFFVLTLLFQSLSFCHTP